MAATTTSPPAAPDAKTLLAKADKEQSEQQVGLGMPEPGEQPAASVTGNNNVPAQTPSQTAGDQSGSPTPTSVQLGAPPDQNQQPQQTQQNPLADGSSYLPVSQSMWGAPARQTLEAATQGMAKGGFSLTGMPGSEDGSFSLDQVPGNQGKTEGMSVNDLKGMSTADARDYIRTHNDISSDDAATFLNQRAIDDDASQSQNDKASVFANDVSNALNDGVQRSLSKYTDAGSIIKAVIDPSGIGENFLNGVMGFAKGLGIEGRTWLQAVGNQDPTPFYARLEQRRLDGSITQSDYNTDKTLLDKVTQINQDRLAKGIGGTFETPESIQEEQSEQAQKAMLLMKVDPDLATGQLSKATQEGLVGLELHGDQVKGAIDGAGSLFRPGSIDVTKLLGGDSMFSHMSHDQIKSLIEAERQVQVPMAAHQNAQMLSADQTGGKIVNWDPNVKAISEWWNNTARDTGLAPKYSAYASPQTLANEGLALDPGTVQAIADNHTQLLAALLTENPEMAEAMEGLTSAGLKGAAGLTRGANWTLGQFNAFSRRGKLGWITPILDGLHALYGGDPAAATFSVARDIALERGLPFINKWGKIAADNLDSMATNQYNGSPLWWQLGSRGTRLTADSITKSLPYAMLTSGGDPKQFMDNMGQLVPLHLLTGVPKVGLSSVAGSTGDALWGKTEQGKATRNLFPGEQPEPSLLQKILFGGEDGKITRMKPLEGYGVDDQLDKESNNNIAAMNTNDANTAITAQHFLKGTTDVYYVTPNTLQEMQNRFGANAQQTPRGLFIEPRLTGTGRSAAFVDINHFHEALPHEVVGHSVYYGLPDAIKQQVGDGVIKDGDPDAFIKNNYNQNVSYDSLPDHPDPANPGALSKDLVREEMSVEEIGRYFNNGNIAQYYKAKPTLLEKMRIASGSFLERMGFPSSTWESTSPMGVNPGFARATDYAGYMRQLAKNALKNPPIDPNWPTQWPKFGETVADTQARRAAELGQVPNASQPTTPTTPTAPPAHEDIARRAYEIGQEREATGAGGDHLSDWLQAENELRSGRAAPKTGPEAQAPDTPGRDSDEYHQQLEELIEKGVPPGEAQAIVEGRQPKTLEDETTGPKSMPQGGGRPVWQPGGGIGGRIASIATPFVVRGQEEAARHPPALDQGPELVGKEPQTTEQLTKTKPVAPEAPGLDLSKVKGSEGAEQPKQQPVEQHPAKPAPAPTPSPVKQEPTGDNTGVADFFRKRGDQPITNANDPRLTDVTVGGQSWKVNKEAAPSFQGFLNDLSAAGAPVNSSGGWNYRTIAGTSKLSEHAWGGAIDVNQTGRNEVTPAFSNWIRQHPQVLQQLENKWHIYGGERFGDLGHFEWGGVSQDEGLAIKGQGREEVAPLEQPKGAPNTERQMRATWFGRNPDGSVDTYDEAKMGYYAAHHGAWGADLLNPNLKGVAVSPSFLRANGIDPSKNPSGQGYKVRVTAPNGRSEVVDIVDLGPKNTVDMTYGLGKALGLSDNSQLKVEVLDHQGKSIALKDEPQGGGGGGSGATKGPGDQFGPGDWLNVPPEAPIGAEEEKPFAQVPNMEEAEREGAATGGYGGGGGYEEPSVRQTPFASMYPFGMPSAAQMRAPMTQGESMQLAQQNAAYSMQPPAAPGESFAGSGVSYMPAKRGGGKGAPAEEESTLGESMPKGMDKVTPLLSQGLTGLKQAQQQHAKLLSPDDTRVRQQGSGSSSRFKGEHFLPDDPVHQAALASVPDQEKTVLAAGQRAIQDRKPMHMTYLSAPPARETPISRQSRAVDYDESSPEARLMGTTQGRLAGHSVIPLSVGISTPRKKGDPNRGYIEGISTSAAAHNHALINEALGMMGEPTPYPELRTPKFRNDLRGYVQNLLAGHSGTGAKYQVGTEDYPVKPDKKYVPYRLKQKEADFMNAILNNQRARTTPAVRELAQKAGTLLSPEGEVNPLRESIDREEIKDPQLKYAANERWSKHILEPTIRTFKAGLIKSLHEDPGSIPADLRQNVAAYRKLTGVLSQEMGQKKGWPDIPTAVHFMPAPLSPEEHQELTGNIRKQFISGKLKTGDYLQRLQETPEAGEALRPPVAGRAGRADTLDTKYPRAEEQVDGRIVGNTIPNQASIGATLDNYKVLPGVRHIPMHEFDQAGPPLTENQASDHVKALRDAIANSGRINPLIVAEDEQGPYVLEGANRFDALRMLGARAFPALVARDLDALPEGAEPHRAQGGGVHYMPMAGPKARKFGEAQKAGQTFETPLPGGGQRFEIDDRDMEFKPPSRKAGAVGRNALEERYITDKRGTGTMPLSDAIRHPELFENYPFLRNTKISMDPTIRHYGHHEQPWLDEYGTPRGDHIVIKDPTDKETLAHEIQHAVQYHEGFSGKGSNTEDSLEALRSNMGVREELRKQWDAAHPERQQMSTEEFIKDERKRTGWQDQRLRDMAKALYWTNPGEVEARVAGRRAIRLTPEQRAQAEEEGLGAQWENTPKEDVFYEAASAATRARKEALMSPTGLGGFYGSPRSEGPGIAYMPGGKPPKPAKVTGSVESEPGYVYHATNAERLHDIAQTGKLLTHRPDEFTDQDSWPDGSTEKRNYFTPTADRTWQFAPEEGIPALLRMQQEKHPIRKESTGDLYSTKPVPSKHLEYLGDDQGWHPVSGLKEPETEGEPPAAPEGPGIAYMPGGKGEGNPEVGAPPAPGGGIHYMAAAPKGKKAKEPAPPREISKATLDQLGPRPEDEEQGKAWDKHAARLDKQIPGAIPLRSARNKKGQLKLDGLGNPEFEKEGGGYHLANAPMLGKRALGYDEKGTVNKAPEGTVDTIDPDDLTYLTPADRLRVSHLDKNGAIDMYADALHKEYNRIEKDVPQALKAKDWYNDTEGYLKQHFPEPGAADMVANLLAATSPRTFVKTNYGFGMNAAHRYLRGDYDRHIKLYQKAYQLKQAGELINHVSGLTDRKAGVNYAPTTDAKAMAAFIMHHDILPTSHDIDDVTKKGPQYGMHSDAVLRVLAGHWLDQLEGPKTRRYTGNLSGRDIQSTGDMWVARELRRLAFEGHTKEPWLVQPPAESGLSDLDFAIQELAHRRASARRDLEPRQNQAIHWTSEILHWLKNGWATGVDPAERDYRPMLKEYQRPEWAKRKAA